MKIRSGFVSNSSSSSFLILKEGLSDEQISSVIEHKKHADNYFNSNDRLTDEYHENEEDGYSPFHQLYGFWDIDGYDVWNIEDHLNYILTENGMDNFDLMSFCIDIFNIPKDNIYTVESDMYYYINDVDSFVKQTITESRKNKLERVKNKK